MTVSKWKEIRNDYTDESGLEKGFVTMYIDSWITDDELEDEEGKVIVKIKMNINSLPTFEIEYLDKDAMADVYAQEVISEGIEELKEDLIDYQGME